MFFRKRPPAGVPSNVAGHAFGSEATPPELYPIDFDMLLKGNTILRHGQQVRQFGVYVDGVVRLVTSGDRVDRKTYEALLAVGALRSSKSGERPPSGRAVVRPAAPPTSEEEP